MEITAGLLSTEPNGFDGIIRDFRDTHRFDFSGLDADAFRDNVRLGFAHFSGLDPALSSFEVPIGNRRRFVVLNTVNDSPESLNEVVLITNDYRTAKAEEVKAAIDSVTLESGSPQDDPYAAWLNRFEFLEGESALLDDPDQDGVVNLHEFYFDSDPTDAGSVSLPKLMTLVDEGRVLQYHGQSNIMGFDRWAEVSEDLKSWRRLDLPDEAWISETLPDGSSQTTVLIESFLRDEESLHFRIVVQVAGL